MSDNKNRLDFYSGVPWVNVTPEQARGHPKGHLHWVLWLIVAYFIGIAIFKFWWLLDAGGGVYLAVLNSIWPFLAGLGLALRVPWSVIMAIVATAVTAWVLVRGLGSGSSLIVLFEMIVNVGILFYLMDGDRPNLIYRHRYRQYSADKGADDDAG